MLWSMACGIVEDPFSSRSNFKSLDEFGLPRFTICMCR